MEELAAVCRDNAPVALAPEAKQRILESRQVVDMLVDEAAVVYGRAVPGTPGCYNQGRNRICAHEFLQGRFPKGSRSKSRVGAWQAPFSQR